MKRKYTIWIYLFLLITLLATSCSSISSRNTPDDTQAPPPPGDLISTIDPITTTPSLIPSLVPSKTPLATLPPIATPTPIQPARIKLLFTGNIVPARCVQARIDELDNPDYPYEEVVQLISSADLAVGTLNATMSDSSKITGCITTFVLTGRPENAFALARAGFDAISTATNHIKNCGLTNCGDRAFLDTLENLRQAAVRPIGAGVNLEEALKPQVFTLQGVDFAIVALGEIEAMAFASENSPGIAVLDEENLRNTIQQARREADVVIVMPHWGPEYSAIPNYRQLNFARIAVEAGADLVVGDHTHTVQGYETIDGVPVFYGLGNFMFDQGWSEETSQGVALTVTYFGKELESYELIPVHIDWDGRVHLADDDEAGEILGRMEAANAAAGILNQ
jgi:poly-gamma-glutamate capsule biosynthesis protein CapA/YwtB (metallophosphatase superfamily)